VKILTIATKPEGYYPVLKRTALQWGYDLDTLGWQQPWQGFAWKLQLYIDALAALPPNEIVIGVDGYDVVVIGAAEETLATFKQANTEILFSGQRYFPNQKRIKKLADKVMRFESATHGDQAYNRPCMGLFIGYANQLHKLFTALMDIEKEHQLNDDQTLLNHYYAKNPTAFTLDTTCSIFQNLWRTSGGLYGTVTSKKSKSDVITNGDKEQGLLRLQNRTYHTLPTFIHGPFNLNMGPLLNELQIDHQPITFKKGWNYWRYSLVHHIKRGLKYLIKRK